MPGTNTFQERQTQTNPPFWGQSPLFSFFGIPPFSYPPLSLYYYYYYYYKCQDLSDAITTVAGAVYLSVKRSQYMPRAYNY